MKKLILLIFLQLLFYLAAFPQSSGYYCICKSNHGAKLDFKPRLRGKNFINEYTGDTIQYFNYWTRGKVVLRDSTVIKKEYLRYNRYTDELLWLRKNDLIPIVVDKTMLSGFELQLGGGREKAHFILKYYKPRYLADTMKVFFQVLEDGPIGLYVLRDINQEYSSKEMSVKDRYFISQNGTFKNIKANRWSLYKFLSRKNQQWFPVKLFTDSTIKKMRRIIRTNYLHIREEKDFARALEIYNQQKTEKTLQ
jgi:hypothetical protein